jgi:hypothetical protein
LLCGGSFEKKEKSVCHERENPCPFVAKLTVWQAMASYTTMLIFSTDYPQAKQAKSGGKPAFLRYFLPVFGINKR